MANPEFRSRPLVELVDWMGDDQRVADAARVSTGTSGTPVADGFIDFLVKNRHGSPFESAVFTYRVETPLFVAREFQRHRIASYNEESGRYKKLEPVFYVPDYERDLVQVGKPGEYEFAIGTDRQYDETTGALKNNSIEAYSRYEHLLEIGVAREIARMVLPLNTFTSFYVTMNARSLMNFFSLRNRTPDTTVPTFPQHEIEQVAHGMEVSFQRYMPMTHRAFCESGRVAP